jgi:hypothetical protein
VGQVKQLAAAGNLHPNRLRHIGDRIATALPRREDADLRLALRIDSAVEKTDPRMPSAGIAAGG